MMICVRLVKFNATSATVRLFRTGGTSQSGFRRWSWRKLFIVTTGVAVSVTGLAAYRYRIVSRASVGGESIEDDKTAVSRLLLQKYGLDKTKSQNGTLRAFEHVVSKF